MIKILIFVFIVITLLTIALTTAMFCLFAATSHGAPKWLSGYLLITQLMPLAVVVVMGIKHSLKLLNNQPLWPLPNLLMGAAIIYVLSIGLQFVLVTFKLFGMK